MATSAKSKGGGVLPISAAATRKPQGSQTSARSAQRAPAPRLKLIVRRLPPGLTELEFWSALGEDWHVSKGKVDWAAYQDGKISKDPSKPSRPARAYLKVKDQTILDSLSLTIKQTSFQDAKNTSKDSCLLGPPSLEFATYSKIPSGRVRHDGRQGTIDQDQEFIDFLQSLTEPIVKPGANGAESTDVPPEKVTTTPLVQYLKEKKANKAKETAEKKSKAKQEGKEKEKEKDKDKDKETKSSKPEPKPPVVVRGSTAAAEKARVAKATQEAVKAINKSVATMKAKQAPAKPDAKVTSQESTPPQPQTAPPKRERERGNVSAAARMLQRDLGLAPKSPRAARTTPASSATGKADPTPSEKVIEPPTGPKSSTSTPTATTVTPPAGPRNTRPSPVASTPASTTTPTPSAPKPSTPSNPPPQRNSKPPPNPSPNARSAFLKHANPSQGVTEELLRTVFATFGTVTRCEIDKKKGLGYIDFESTESLRNAMHASPVKVGSGSVVVLENRNQSQSQGQGKGKGAGAQVSGAAGGKSTVTPASAASTVASTSPVTTSNTPAPVAASQTTQPTSPTTTQSPVLSTTAQAPAQTPPTAPRAATSRGSSRASARGASGAPRGGAQGSAASRGNPRGGGFRGGRGGVGGPGRGGRGGGGNTRGEGGGGGGESASTQTSTGAGESTGITGGAGDAN